MKRPLLPVLCAYCLGLCAARWQVLTLSQALTGFGLAFAGMVICFLLKRRLPATLAGIALFVFTGVLFLAPCRQPRLPSSHIVNLCGTGQVNLEGTIRESPAQRPGRTRFVVEARSVHTRDVTRPASGLVQVSIRTVNKKLRCGDRVRFFCRLKRPHNFNNPGSFDYVGYLADKRIFAKAFLPDDRGVVVVGVGDAPVLTLLVERFRDRVRDQIGASCSSPAREMIQALVLGEKGMLPADIKADFSRLGISHLLAISGLHMGIVTWLAYALIMAGLKCYPRILLYLDGWKWAAVLAVIPAVLYGFVAGFQLPTVRALLMICAYVSALLLGRGHNLVNALMLA
ncbi:MAG: ComEC family competence protein, partial [Deltaproteobacteria bacterium]|nr:ComEC family competence protein [Deltaproteobacteria bacterium]